MFGTILNVLLVVISIALIILCLLQSGKSDGIVNALTGQSSNLFAQQKERGADLVMSYYWFSNCIFRYCNHSKNVINNRAKVLFLFWNREVNE